MRRRAVALALVGAALSACGTTVNGTDAAGGVTGVQGLGAPDAHSTSLAGPSGGPAAASAVGGPAASTGLAGPRAGTTGVAPSPVPAVTGGAGPAGVTGRGPIDIGIGVDGNNGPFAAAFGFSNSQPNEQKAAAAVVTYINSHGGLAGHPVRATYATFDNTSSDWNAQDQAMCAKFTQDHRVVAVVRTDDIFGPLDACLAQAHTPLVLWESVFRPRQWWQAAPGLRFTPDDATGARIYAALTDRMVATHHWSPRTKIGLVRYDRSDQAQVQKEGLEAAFATHHLTLADWEAVHTPESFQDLGTTSSELASAILRMRQKGVTSVVFMGGDVAYLFAQEATSQNYYPAYAMTSFDFPSMLPTSVLSGAYGIGWAPADDITAHLPPTPATKRCQRAMSGVGVNWTATGADRFYMTCDQLFFLQAAYNAVGAVGPGALAAGARLTGALASSYSFGADLSRHPDGLAAFRDLAYVGSCSCLRYGRLMEMP